MNETLEQLAIRVAKETANWLGTFRIDDEEAIEFSRRLFEEYRKQQEPTCVVTKTGIITNVTDRPLEPGLKLFTSPQPTPEEVKDAARYRYLREENSKTYEEGALFVGFDDETGGDWVGSDLDYVIDKAMSAELGAQGEEK